MPRTSPAKTPSVEAFLESIADSERRQDCRTILALMSQVVPSAPKMWGTSIVGVGDFHYRYPSGREGDTFVLGFSPRKAAITLYLGYDVGRFDQLLARLGKHTIGKGCLYVRSLADVDEKVLLTLLREAAAGLR